MSDVHKILRRYFGELGRQVTVDSIRYGAFFCTGVEAVAGTDSVSLGWRIQDTRAGEEVVVPPEGIISNSASEAICLTQWLFNGSTPRLVFYDRGSNVNIISGENENENENEDLEIIYTGSGRIQVAEGKEVSTGYGVYNATMGPTVSSVAEPEQPGATLFGRSRNNYTFSAPAPAQESLL